MRFDVYNFVVKFTMYDIINMYKIAILSKVIGAFCYIYLTFPLMVGMFDINMYTDVPPFHIHYYIYSGR